MCIRYLRSKEVKLTARVSLEGISPVHLKVSILMVALLAPVLLGHSSSDGSKPATTRRYKACHRLTRRRRQPRLGLAVAVIEAVAVLAVRRHETVLST